MANFEWGKSGQGGVEFLGFHPKIVSLRLMKNPWKIHYVIGYLGSYLTLLPALYWVLKKLGIGSNFLRTSSGLLVVRSRTNQTCPKKVLMDFDIFRFKIC